MLPTSCQCKVTLGPETIEIIEITTIPIISIIQWSWLGGLWTEGLGWARLGSSAGLETPSRSLCISYPSGQENPRKESGQTVREEGHIMSEEENTSVLFLHKLFLVITNETVRQEKQQEMNRRGEQATCGCFCIASSFSLSLSLSLSLSPSPRLKGRVKPPGR